MQPAVRTPNSILRKRNKENEDVTGEVIKHVKLVKRRVSFAPDDELETKYIFKKDSELHSSDNLRQGARVQAVATATAPATPTERQLVGGPLSALPSTENLSPLSMELTDNSSFRQPCTETTAPAPGLGSIKGSSTIGATAAADSLSLRPQAIQLHHQHAPCARLDITRNVPKLSNIAEEYQEDSGAAGISSGLGGETDAPMSLDPSALGTAGSGYLPPDSPMSPNSMREMQACRDSEHQANQDDAHLREVWGYTPGEVDTLAVNCCREVMGEKTYNHVYGSGTLGDLIRPTNGGVVAGRTNGSPEAGFMKTLGEAAARVQAAGAANQGVLVASDPAVVMPTAQQLLRHVRGEQPQFTELSAIQAQPLKLFNAPADLALQPLQTCVQIQVHSTPCLENTTRLLEDDQTEAWRPPGQPAGAFNRGRLSVASNRVLAPGYRRGPSRPGAGETAMLLGSVTMTMASEGNGANANTFQLLAETSNQRAAYERLVQDLPGIPNSQITAVPPARPLRPLAAAGAAMEQCSAMAGTRNISLELRVGGSGELLEDGGLSLDNFQVPPEPTTALSQVQYEVPQEQQRLGQQRHPGDCEVFVLPHTRGRAVQPVAQPATVQGSLAARMSFQDFLRLIDVSFINKVCRETFVPGFDQLPTTVSEIFEAATCMISYVKAYHGRSVDITARLVNIANHVNEWEIELTLNKQELFMEVQALPHAELDIVKDKFASLKELCRMRTVRQIKQSHLEGMADYLAELKPCKTQLEEDLKAMTAEVERLRVCAEDANAIPLRIARLHQEEDERMQEALQRKRSMESHLQRLKDLRAQNQERQRRLDAAREEQQAKAQSRPSLSSLMDECRELEERAAELRSCLSTNAMTPGREGQLIRQAAKTLEKAEAILGLHGLQLDLTMMEHTGTFRLLFRKAYSIVATAANDFIDVSVACEDATAAGIDGLATSLQDRIRATSSGLSCRIPHAQLPLRLELILEQSQRLVRIAQQLESTWMRFDCMQRPYVEVTGMQQVADGDEPLLVLQFTNADTVTKVNICMPWSAALHSDFVKPQLRVQLLSLDPPETQQKYCDALLDTVLSKLGPSSDYITAVCYAMSETLRVSEESA